MLDPPPRGADARHAIALLLAQPGLDLLRQRSLPQKVNDLAHENEHKGNGIHPVDAQVEDLDANGDAPEVARQQGDVEEGGRGEAEEHGGERVEEEQHERVARQVAADVCVPHGGAEAVAVEDARLRAVDQHAPEAELAHHLVQRALRHQKLLAHVGDAVQRGAQQREQVALERVERRGGPAGGQVVGPEEDAHAADAEQDADDLQPVVAHLEEEEGDDDHDDNGPEVDELGGQDGGVAVGQDDEVVALDVEEGQDQEAPAVLEHHLAPALEAVLVDGVAGVDDVEQHVVEEGLEGRDAGALARQQLAERVGRRDADGEHLAQQQRKPELLRPHVREPLALGPGVGLEHRVPALPSIVHQVRHAVPVGRRRCGGIDVVGALGLHNVRFAVHVYAARGFGSFAIVLGARRCCSRHFCFRLESVLLLD